MAIPIPEDAPFILKVRLGLVPGHSIIHRSGFNPDTDSSTKETVWAKGGLYEFQDVARELYLSSSDALDVSQSFRIKLLDADYKETTEIVTLDGQNSVLIPNGPYIRCNGAMNVSVGENPSLGNVSVGTSDTTLDGVPGLSATLAYVRLEAQIDEQTVFTVPANYTGFIMNLSASVGKNKDAVVHGAFREDGGTFKNTEQIDIFQETVQRTIPYSIMPSRSDLMMVGTSENNNSDLSAGFDILLVNNAYLKNA